MSFSWRKTNSDFLQRLITLNSRVFEKDLREIKNHIFSLTKEILLYFSPFVKKSESIKPYPLGDPTGTRTQVAGMRIQRPRPLDDGAVHPVLYLN